MNRADYDRYVSLFNARDYDGVLDHYAERFELAFAGYTFRTRDEVLNFYRFFHQYVDESVIVSRFVSDQHTVALEADVRLQARSDLTRELLAEHGLERLIPLKSGETVTLPQFIHYHLENGKIVRALCAVYEPPRS